MAQRVQIVCDLDETEAVGTTKLAVDSRNYRLDLCEKHVTLLADQLQPYLEVAARDNGNGNGQTRPRGNGQARLIRAWAASNGIPVPAKGRIPAQITEQYTAAH